MKGDIAPTTDEAAVLAVLEDHYRNHATWPSVGFHVWQNCPQFTEAIRTYGQQQYDAGKAAGRAEWNDAHETARMHVREASYPLHRGLHHPGAFTHCQDAACRNLLGVLVQLNENNLLAEAQEQER